MERLEENVGKALFIFLPLIFIQNLQTMEDITPKDVKERPQEPGGAKGIHLQNGWLINPFILILLVKIRYDI